MSEKQWWCDWYVSPSKKPYLRDDERFFFHLALLIPSIGLLSSWSGWNNQSLFPWWYSLFWSIILVIICLWLSCYYQLYFIDLFVQIVSIYAWPWHGVLLLIDTLLDDVKVICDSEKNLDGLSYLFCIWPSGRLCWGLLRDGPCLTMVISLALSFHFRPKPPPVISAPFNARLLNPPVTLNTQREQRRQRRPSFVIHYVLVRVGRIRRRRRLFRN